MSTNNVLTKTDQSGSQDCVFHFRIDGRWKTS